MQLPSPTSSVAVQLPNNIEIPAGLGDMTTISDEGLPIRFQRVPGRKAIAASDDFSLLGVSKTATSLTSTRTGCSTTWPRSSMTTCRSHPPASYATALHGWKCRCRTTSPRPKVWSSDRTRSPRRHLMGLSRPLTKRTITKTVCDNNGHCAGRTWRAAEVPTLTYSTTRIADASPRYRLQRCRRFQRSFSAFASSSRFATAQTVTAS